MSTKKKTIKKTRFSVDVFAYYDKLDKKILRFAMPVDDFTEFKKLTKDSKDPLNPRFKVVNAKLVYSLPSSPKVKRVPKK